MFNTKITEPVDRVKWDYRGERKIIPLGQWLPKIAVDAYIAPNVVLSGQVNVLDGSSVWNGAVLRGDLNKITVGFCSNVEEKCVLHAASSSPTVRYGYLFSHIDWIVLSPGRRIPSGELWAGNPARFVRKLTHEETLEIPKLAVDINYLGKEYFNEYLPYSNSLFRSGEDGEVSWFFSLKFDYYYHYSFYCYFCCKELFK
ncbi:putative trimeric LpxA-like superfamily protein [Helianthus debilis subsp. tardiflorus]